jgi:hypothetical protein
MEMEERRRGSRARRPSGPASPSRRPPLSLAYSTRPIRSYSALLDQSSQDQLLSLKKHDFRSSHCPMREDFDFYYRLATNAALLTASDPPLKFMVGPNQKIELIYNDSPVSDIPSSSSATASNEASESSEEPQSKRSRSMPPEWMVEEFTCFICMSIMSDPTSLPCGHSGCMKCLQKAIARSKQCPVCRKPTGDCSLAVTISLRTIIGKLFPKPKPATVSIELDMRRTQELLGGAFGMIVKPPKPEHAYSTFFLTESDAADDNGDDNEEDDGDDSDDDEEGKFIHKYSFKRFPLHRLFLEGKWHQYAAYAPLLESRQLAAMTIAHQQTYQAEFTTLHPVVLFNALKDYLHDGYSVYSSKKEACETYLRLRNQHNGSAASNGLGDFSVEDLFTNRGLTRVLRRAGVIFEDEAVFDVMREKLTEHISKLLDAVFTFHTLRKGADFPVLSADDFLAALSGSRSEGRVYGYGGSGGLRLIFVDSILKVLRHIDPAIGMDEIAVSIVHDMIVAIFADLSKVVTKICTDVSNGFYPHFIDHPHLAGRNHPRHLSFPRLSAHLGEVPIPVVIYDAVSDENVFQINHVVTEKELIVAIKNIFSEIQSEEAISAGKKAVKSFHASPASNRYSDLGVHSELLFSPEIVALTATYLLPEGKNLKFSTSAIIFLTAVLEYVANEILDLCKTCIDDHSQTEITARDVYLAVRGDEQLDKLLPGTIRYGGTIPYIHQSIRKVSVTGELLPGAEEFRAYMMNKILTIPSTDASMELTIEI